MAVRSGAGTGVVVALVVFVLTTVFLLVMSIVFYRGQTEARQSKAEAERLLGRYIKPAQRSQDLFTAIEASAESSNQSVAEFQRKRYEDLMALADGNAATRAEDFQRKVADLGDDGGTSLYAIARRLDSQLRQTQTEVESKDRRIAERDGEIEQLRDEMEQMRTSHQSSLEQVRGEMDRYGALVSEYNTRLGEAITDMDDRVRRLEFTKNATIEGLEVEKDSINQQLVVMSSRLAELQSRWEEIRERGRNPALLVDGRVIDTSGADQVFIDRGRRDRIVLGMTFEVYDDEAALMDPVTRQIQPGKASMQVIKVGESTSTCKVTRATPGRPVLRQDVIANAVYDPRYEFSFLIHGNFDIDRDNRATPAEADYLRSLVYDWGGKVVTGQEIPGDLDFLVLGVEPPMPPDLPTTAPSDALFNDWLLKKQAHQAYNNLRDQANRAQIPILNANRFLILIGYGER